jgi:predicted ester cyclase
LIVFAWIASACTWLFTPYIHAQAQPSDYKTLLTGVLDSAYNLGDIAPLDAAYAPEYVRYPGGNDRVQVMGSILALRAAMPDLAVTHELMIVEGEWVAARIRLNGTFQNELVFPNALPVSPNSQPIALVTHSVFRFNEAGQVIEEWNGFDNLNFLAQVGAVPAPGSSVETPLIDSMITLNGTEAAQEATLTRYFEVLNAGDFSVIESLVAGDALAQNPFGGLDRSGVIADLTALRGALPDLKFTVGQLISEGNWTAALYAIQGTFTADFRSGSSQPFKPTNNPLELMTVTFYRFDETGMITGSWELYDSWTFLTQLGLLTADDPRQ